MADIWITDITHFLDDNGEMIVEPVQARKIAEYFAAIAMLASHPDVDTDHTFPSRAFPSAFSPVL